MARKTSADYSKWNALRAFEQFAPKGQTKLHPKEVIEIMVDWAKIPEQEARKLVSQLETDSDGLWDFKKYVGVMAPE